MDAVRPSLWILEDDAGIRFVYEELLGVRYSLRLFATLASFKLAWAEDTGRRPDMMIADLNLGGQSFLAYVASSEAVALRRIPILVVSSSDDVEILRDCFNSGVEDYLTKPFGRSELIVKIDRILQSSKNGVVDLDSPELMRGLEGDLALTAKEFQILAALRQARAAAAKEDIIMAVWGKRRLGPKTFDVHLHNLRRKLASLNVRIDFQPPNRYALIYSRD